MFDKNKKHGKLKDIQIKEVSMVDNPANELPFLFFKQRPVKKSGLKWPSISARQD